MKQANDVLGYGTYGHVSIGRWKNRRVAIKKPSAHPRAIHYMDNEIAIHSKLVHPNIVAFLGTAGESLSHGFAMELMIDGNLKSWLKGYQGPIPYHLQVSIAIDIAKGIHYLHDTMNIIHRDLKPDNILIEKRGESLIVKIGDFGFATSLDCGVFNERPGSQGFIAPELYKFTAPYPFSPKSDIFAFAVILWILTSKHHPLEKAATKAHLRRILRRGERDIIPQNTPPDFARLITCCWSQSPQQRPSSLEVNQRLIEMLANTSQQTTPIDVLKQPDAEQKLQSVIALYNAAKRGDFLECQLLVKQMVYPDYVHDTGDTCLMIAAKYGHANICQLLIEHGADLDIQDKSGDTAEQLWPDKFQDNNPFRQLRNDLFLLANNATGLSRHRQECLLDLVLNKNTSLLDWPLEEEKDKRNFLFFAFIYGDDELITKLTTHPQWTTWSQITLPNGFTLLHIMADNNQVDRCRYLAAININDVDNCCKASALSATVSKGHLKFCEWLISQGANLDLQDKWGDSALIRASKRENEDLCQLLLEHGANPDLQNIQGETALIRASKRGNFNLCQLLLEHGANPWLKYNNVETAEELWCTRHPLQKNPFNPYCRSLHLERKTNQMVAILNSLNFNVGCWHLYGFFYNRETVFDDLMYNLRKASFTSADSDDRSADDLLNDIIDDWEVNLDQALSQDAKYKLRAVRKLVSQAGVERSYSTLQCSGMSFMNHSL